ncbi:hypothetical protein [Streptosporangium amethystogenes]|uniref:hypothetical protein n=1 Tax=Streptosporangium amethystogenes TaxID=2002 RepID=UPI0004CA59C6|nr:hypothetical protein [Streptosporangium amethystogenes]
MFGWLAWHRARRRTEAALQQAAWQRRQLARDIERLAVVAAELVEAEHRLVDVDQADGAVATDPVTGWEARLAELATNLSRLASTIAGTARGHAATAGDYRQAATRIRNWRPIWNCLVFEMSTGCRRRPGPPRWLD